MKYNNIINIIFNTYINNKMYDFTKIHNDILEQLSKLDKCSNFILTEQQFKNALDTNQQIIKPYIGFTNEKKRIY